MTRNRLYILAIILLGLLFIIFQIRNEKRVKEQRAYYPLEVLEDEDIKFIDSTEKPLNGLYIPVTMDDAEYLFIWDTGSGVTGIMDSTDSPLITKHGLKITETDIDFEGVYGLMEDLPITNEKPIIINGNHIKTCFYIKKYLRDISKISLGYIGVLGMDIINRYYWDIDLEHKQFRMSTKPIKIQDESVLDIKQKYKVLNNFTITYKDTVLIDSLSELVFDTGYGGIKKYKYNIADILTKFNIYNDNLLKLKSDLHIKDTVVLSFPQDIIISESQTELFNKIKDIIGFPSYKNITTREEVIILDSVKINGYNMNNVVIVKHKHYSPDIYITANFLRRFQRMVYNPIKSTYCFYATEAYAKATESKLGKEIDLFIEESQQFDNFFCGCDLNLNFCIYSVRKK